MIKMYFHFDKNYWINFSWIDCHIVCWPLFHLNPHFFDAGGKRSQTGISWDAFVFCVTNLIWSVYVLDTIFLLFNNELLLIMNFLPHCENTVDDIPVCLIQLRDISYSGIRPLRELNMFHAMLPWKTIQFTQVLSGLTNARFGSVNYAIF